MPIAERTDSSASAGSGETKLSANMAGAEVRRLSADESRNKAEDAPSVSERRGEEDAAKEKSEEVPVVAQSERSFEFAQKSEPVPNSSGEVAAGNRCSVGEHNNGLPASVGAVADTSTTQCPAVSTEINRTGINKTTTVSTENNVPKDTTASMGAGFAGVPVGNAMSSVALAGSCGNDGALVVLPLGLGPARGRENMNAGVNSEAKTLPMKPAALPMKSVPTSRRAERIDYFFEAAAPGKSGNHLAARLQESDVLEFKIRPRDNFCAALFDAIDPAFFVRYPIGSLRYPLAPASYTTTRLL